ncbi:hypothetical protein FSP39_007915 [Pinctada imbricata]|uniref:Nicotinamide N-methyltransferase-like protein n=1 Tax=Pinctada imbricata TaxID=66713 RepID=A0AA88YK46_PINIB|nr:hypothetical protein FSP39_007915 [Pinctada imbricata]
MAETRDYVSHFDPEVYLKSLYESMGSYEKGDIACFLQNTLHKIFNSEIQFGEKLLDIGSGPTIQSVLSASRRITRIDLTDFTPKNLQVLRDWKDGKRNEVEKLIRYEMKLAGDSRNVSERESEVRSKVHGIYRIDATTEQVFKESIPDDPQYDVITSSLCLEDVSTTLAGYKTAVRNVSKYLKKGGYFVLLGVIEESKYRIGDYIFLGTSLKAEEIRATWREHGFKILQWISDYPEDAAESKDVDNFFGMLAKKE